MPDTTNPSEAQLAVVAAIDVLNELGAPDVVMNDGSFLGAFLAGVAAVFRTQGNTGAEAVAIRAAGHAFELQLIRAAGQALDLQLIRDAGGTENEAAAG